MIIAEYKCGYCGSSFKLSYFTSQDIPERNVGCTTCRIAGDKVTLIRKIRDERSLKRNREGQRGGLEFLQGFPSAIGYKAPFHSVDASKIFVLVPEMETKKEKKKGKKTLNLLYPITVLEAERDNIHRHPAGHLNQLQRAIDILIGEKYKLEREKFKKEVEEMKRVEDLTKHLRRSEPTPYVKRSR